MDSSSAQVKGEVYQASPGTQPAGSARLPVTHPRTAHASNSEEMTVDRVDQPMSHSICASRGGAGLYL